MTYSKVSACVCICVHAFQWVYYVCLCIYRWQCVCVCTSELIFTTCPGMYNTQVWVYVTGHTYILHRCSHVCECAWRRGENAVTAHAVIVLERRGRTRPALSEGTLSLVLYASLVTSAISLYIAAHQRPCCHYQRLTWLLEWFIIRQGCRDTSGIIKDDCAVIFTGYSDLYPAWVQHSY